MAGPEGDGCWPRDRRRRPAAVSPAEARQAAMTSGPDDCHVTMQAAMAVRGLVLRWP